jgi:hypothetical protein
MFDGVVSFGLIKWLRNEPNKTEHEPTNGRSIYYGSGHLNLSFCDSGAPFHESRSQLDTGLENVREHGIDLARGRRGARAEDLWDELPELLRFCPSSEIVVLCMWLKTKFCIQS